MTIRHSVNPAIIQCDYGIAAMQASAMRGPFESAPAADAHAREAGRAFAKRSGVSEHLSNMPLGQTGYPDDLAEAVLFMASDLASYVSGTSLTVDGAQTSG
jgi:NAD(P)-dependent dehydrogenase (short-subunit alcohol dehydrogenase family)